MTKTSRVPILIVILIAPFAILAFFAVRTLSLEYDALNARRAALLEERLQTTERLILAKLEQLGKDDLSAAREAVVALRSGDMRDLVLNTGELTLIFKDGMRIFPVYSTMMVDQPKPDVSLVEAAAKALLPEPGEIFARPAAALVETGERQYSLLRCSRGAQSLNFCVVIQASDVMAVLRSALGVAARDISLRVFLVDPKGRRAGAAGGDVKGAVVRPLTGILAGWQLQALEPADIDTGLGRTLAEFTIAAFIISAWGFVTWSVHRASTIENSSLARRAAVIAQLSHELRTPLANLRLYIDLLDRKAGDAGAVRGYTQVLDAEVARLEQLSQNAIEATRGAFAAPVLEEGVPDRIVRGIADKYQPLMQAAGCSLSFEAGADRCCRFDRAGLERVLVNLLDNARKYAPGGAVEISTVLIQERLQVSVRDHGPGIPQDEQQHIFEPLIRAQGTSASGFGLGLWAVQSLAQQNGGGARVENANPGACFRVEFGVAPCRDPMRAIPNAVEEAES